MTDSIRKRAVFDTNVFIAAYVVYEVNPSSWLEMRKVPLLNSYVVGGTENLICYIVMR